MPNVLVIEDSLFLRQMLKEVLVKGKWEVKESDSIEDGIEQLKNTKFDVIALSTSLAGVDPIDASEKVAKAASGSVVFLIAKVGQHDIIRHALTLGVKDYVLKPFTEKTVERFNQAIVKQ